MLFESKRRRTAPSEFQRLQRAGAFQLLGTLYPDAASGAALLTGLGAVMAELPPFGNVPASLYWREVCLRIDRGMFEFGLRELFDAAVRDNPRNRDLPAVVDIVGGPILKVLLLLAGPTDEARIRLEAEHREIRAILDHGQGRLIVEVSPATRVGDIIPELLRCRPDVVHFAGHGGRNGELMVEDDDGTAVPVPIDALAEVFSASGELVCAVFNSCHTGHHGSVALDAARFVVGATRPLPDRSAVAFSRGFYRALDGGRTIPEAFAVAKAQVLLVGGDDRLLTLVERPS